LGSSYEDSSCSDTGHHASTFEHELDIPSLKWSSYSIETKTFAEGKKLDSDPTVICILKSVDDRSTALTSSNLRGGLNYVSPPDDAICDGPLLSPIVLNPFALYANGTDRVEVVELAQQIAMPIQTSRVQNKPTASGLVTDGVSRVFIAARTANTAAPVSMKIVDKGLGHLARFDPETAFSRELPGNSGIIVPASEFLRLPGTAGRRAAVAMFVAPETPTNSSGPRTVLIEITQGEEKTLVSLTLHVPPVYLVHGLWSGPEAWESWRKAFPSEKFASVAQASYASAKSFADPKNELAFSVGLQNLLNSVRIQGIVATQANVVAHSMGALLTRHHASASNYASPANFYAGDVNRLISVNSPHLGSGLASVIVKNRGADVSTGALLALGEIFPVVHLYNAALKLSGTGFPLEGVLRLMGMPVDTAVKALVPRSADLASLPSPAKFPYEAVATYDNDPIIAAEIFIDAVFKSALIRTTVDGVLSDENDVVVSVDSQLAGGSRPMTFSGLIHTDPLHSIGVLDSPVVAQRVACRLLNAQTCPLLPLQPASLPQSRLQRLSPTALEGRTEVPLRNLVLSISSPNLQVNDLHDFVLSSPGYAIEGYAYLISHNGKFGLVDGRDAHVRLFPTDLGTYDVFVLATLSGQKYAMRKWRIEAVNYFPVIDLTPPTNFVQLHKRDAYQLLPTAYLNTSLSRSAEIALDVASHATYRIVSGADVVAVSSTGKVMALAPGRAEIAVDYAGLSVSVAVEVGS
jgi:pimeloyl-ACP methyl ester carboxylesterase